MRNKPPKRNSLFAKRLVAAFLSLTLTLGNGIGYAKQDSLSQRALQKTLSLGENVPSRAETITIPEAFGKVEESSSGTSSKTIIYIRDAHDSLEAQENIAKIIHYLVDKYGVKTVYEEGYEGPVPTDKYFRLIKDSKIREKVSYFYMDKLRVGGAEYAHINRQKDFKLIGADSKRLHLANVNQYRKSAKHKEETERGLASLETEVRKLANQCFTKGLKEWMKLRERLDKNELSLFDYLKRVKSLSSRGLSAEEYQRRYPTISLLIASENAPNKEVVEKVQGLDAKTLFHEISLLENDYAAGQLKEAKDRKVFEYYKALGILKRLNSIELSASEFEAIKDVLHSMNTDEFVKFVAQSMHKPILLSKRWERHIREAITFYDIAYQRDKVIESRLSEFLANPKEDIAVLVFGGFHEGGIKEIFKRNHFAYQILTPKIQQIDKQHQDYYNQLMSVGHYSFEVPVNVRLGARPISQTVIWDRKPASAKSELRVMESVAQLTFPDRTSMGNEMVKRLAQHHLMSRSEVRSAGRQSLGGLPESEAAARDAVAAQIKALGRSGLQDWDELLTLMERYPQYFDRIYLDLDETLFTSKVYLGSHQWHVDEAKFFESGRWRLSAKKSRIEKELVEKGLLRLVEPRLVGILTEMKRRNPNLIIQGLTSRRKFMEESTKKILKSLGLGDLEVHYGAYKGKKLAAIHRDLASNESRERGITLFIDDEVEGFAKHKLMKTIGEMGAVVLLNKKVSNFDMETSLSHFREGLLAEGTVVKGEPQPEDHLIAVLHLSRFSEDAVGRAAVYLDPDIRSFVAAGSDKMKMAFIEAAADFFSRPFEERLSDEQRERLLDFYYGLVSFDKELWKQAHREGKLTYKIINRSLPFLHGRGNYELLLTPENAYFFMEPLLDYLVTEKPNVVLLPDTAARPFTEALRYFIEKEHLATRVINFPISTGDARDTRYELTRWMKLLHGEIPVTDQADEKLVAFLRQSGVDGIHRGDNVVIFDDGITRGHAVSVITNVVESTFKAPVRGAFVTFDYRNNIDKRSFAAFSSFRVYGEFGARNNLYHSAPGVIVRMDWEFNPEFKGVASRRPYNPPPPKFLGEGGGGRVLEAFKDNYQRFFHRSQRKHRLPERAGDTQLTSRKTLAVNAADTVHLPDEIRGYAGDVLAPSGLPREQLIAKLNKLLEAGANGGELVKLLRKQRGLTQNKLGGLRAVSMIERSMESPTDQALNRILSGLKEAYEKDGRLTAQEIDYYVRKGFGQLRSEQASLPDEDKKLAVKKPKGKEDGLGLIRVRDEVPLWAFEDKTIRPRDRRLVREKNVFFYRLVRGGVDLGFVILTVLKNRAGEDSLIIEKIQPRIAHDQDVKAGEVRALIVHYLSENNKTIQALYTDTKIAYMAGVSESHRIRRDLSGGDFRLMPQTVDLWHEGTEEYYKDNLAGDIGLIWRRFNPDQQKQFELAVKYLETLLSPRGWGAALIKAAFEADINRYAAYRRMHLTFDEGDLLVLEEIDRLLNEQKGAEKFADPKAKEEAKFNLRATVELLKYKKLGVKPDFKKLYTGGGTAAQYKAKRFLAVKFFLGNFWDGGYDLAGMNWSEIEKRFVEWGAEDLLDKISGGRKGRFLDYLMPRAYRRAGSSFSLGARYQPSAKDFKRYLNGEWYAVPIGSEYIIQGDENIPPHWKDVPNDFFGSRKGHKVQFEIIDSGLVGREISVSGIVKGTFVFHEGKIHYEVSQSGVIQPKETIHASGGSSDQQKLLTKKLILENAQEVMGKGVLASILFFINDAIDRHPLINSDPRQVLSDFEGFVDEASGFSTREIDKIKKFFDSLRTREDGSFGAERSEVRRAATASASLENHPIPAARLAVRTGAPPRFEVWPRANAPKSHLSNQTPEQALQSIQNKRILIDFNDLARRFSDEQKKEVAFIAENKNNDVKIIIYNVDFSNPLAKLFRSLNLPNLKMASSGLAQAGKSFERFSGEVVHLSSAHYQLNTTALRSVLEAHGISKDRQYLLTYRDQQSGTLGIGLRDIQDRELSQRVDGGKLKQQLPDYMDSSQSYIFVANPSLAGMASWQTLYNSAIAFARAA